MRKWRGEGSIGADAVAEDAAPSGVWWYRVWTDADDPAAPGTCMPLRVADVCARFGQ